MAKKKKALPKAPKKTASLTVHQKHAERIKEVIKYNAQIDADAKKKNALIQSNAKLRSRK